MKDYLNKNHFHSSKPVILYDGECILCINLANWVQKSGEFEIISWQSALDLIPEAYLSGAYLKAKPQELGVYLQNPSSLLTSSDAWFYILNNHPHLAKLNWLAKKLGLLSETAEVLNRLGHWGRKVSPCRKCRR